MAGELRFSMLESIRAYAQEQLAASGEQEVIQQQHADHFLAVAERAEAESHGPEQVRWMDRLDVEHDNLRAAQNWALGYGNAEVALRLAGALGTFWRARGHMSEGRQRLHAALALKNAGPVAARAKAFAQMGEICFNQGNLAAALAGYESSLVLYRELGDQVGIAWILLNMGRLQREYRAARGYLDESLLLFRALGERAGIAMALNELGGYERWNGAYTTAQAYHVESLMLYRELGDQAGMAMALHMLGSIATTQGDLAEAHAYFSESVSLFQAVGNRLGWAWALHNLSAVLAHQGDLSAARAAFSESRAMFRELGDQGGLAWSLHDQGRVELYQGNGAARALLAESLELFRATDDAWGVAWTLTRFGRLLNSDAEFEQAQACFRESVLLHQQAGNSHGIAQTLEECAGLAAAHGGWERAARLCGVAEALRAAIGAPLLADERAAHEQLADAIRTQLSDQAFAAAQASGWAMSRDQAVAYALEEL